MSEMTIIEAAKPQESTAVFTQRRDAIDLLATSRAKAIRAGLFATFLCRPHPTTPPDAEMRQRWRAGIKENFDDLDRLCAILKGRDPLNALPVDLCRWMAKCADKNPDAVAAFERMRDRVRDVCRAAETDTPAEIERALDAHMSNWRAGFHGTVSAFCAEVWADLDKERDQEVATAQATAATISATLARLEHIGKHVRLVSLNASVEAARVGEAGRGLGVIAVEFKALAEEIQNLAVSASVDITKLTTDH